MAPQAPVSPVAPVAPVAPGQPAPAAAPIVNTDALKAQAGNLANNAKAGVNNYVEKMKNDKGVMVVTIVVAVLVVLVLVFGLSKLLNPSYNVVNKYMSGMKNANAEKVAKLYHEDLIEAKYDGEIDDLIDSLEEQFEEFEDEDYKITGYKIRECEKYSEDELEELAEDLQEYYDIDEDEVKAARKYYVRYNTDEDGEKNLNYRSVVVVKIGNKWSLYY